MTESDWNPTEEAVQRDQRSAYDTMRDRCPVARSDSQGWTLFRHQAIRDVLHQPERFSSRVSRNLSVPNGMDPPEHTTYRRLIEPYFSESRIQAFEPVCRRIARDCVAPLATGDTVDLVDRFARPFAAAAQCAFMGWPERFGPELADWVQANQEATLTQDRDALKRLAATFESLVQSALDERQAAALTGDDVTTELLRETVDGHGLSSEEIASILRNWTVGEIGTLAASVGIIAHTLATHPELQARLRRAPERIVDANEEILRWQGPLVDNRRVATTPINLGERTIETGERVTINWVAANRDPQAFSEPETLDIDRDQSDNLLWGEGIHVCPGAPLAQMELRVVVETLLDFTRELALDPERAATPAHYPASGFRHVPIRLQPEG